MKSQPKSGVAAERFELDDNLTFNSPQKFSGDFTRDEIGSGDLKKEGCPIVLSPIGFLLVRYNGHG
jgi:hypothetical protein